MRDMWAALRSLVLPFGKSRGTRINLDGVKGAVLIYDGDDNLIASIAPAAGTDASGKPYREGITSYPPGGPSRYARTAIQLGQNGMITFFAQPGDRALSSDGYIYGFHPGADDTTGPALSLASPTLTAGQVELFLRSQSKNGADPFYASLYPVGGSASEMNAFRFAVSGVLAALRRDASGFVVRETWTNLVPGDMRSGWTAQSAYPPAVRRFADGTVRMRGRLSGTNTANNTAVFQLPDSRFLPGGSSAWMPCLVPGANAVGAVEVWSDGSGHVWGLGTGTAIDLCGISYVAADVE